MIDVGPQYYILQPLFKDPQAQNTPLLCHGKAGSRIQNFARNPRVFLPRGPDVGPRLELEKILEKTSWVSQSSTTMFRKQSITEALQRLGIENGRFKGHVKVQIQIERKLFLKM